MSSRHISAFLFTVAALLGAALVLALALPRATAFYLPNLLHPAGFKETTLTVESVGWTHLTLKNVALDKTLSAKHLKITFLPWGLTGIEARNLTMKARTDGKSLTLGPLTIPLAGSSSAPGSNLPLIRLDQARLELDTPAGPILANLNTEPEGLATRLRLDLQSRSNPPLFAPMVLTGIATEDAKSLRFVGRLNDQMHRLQVNLNGAQNKDDGSGNADIIVKRLEFTKDGLQPKMLYPVLADYFSNADGPVEGEAHLNWQDGKLDSQGIISSHGLSFETKGATVRNLMGTVALNRLWPPRTLTPQSFSIGMLTAGVPLGSGSFAVAIEDNGSIFIKRAVLNLAEGKLRLEPMRLNSDLTGTLNFKATNVDLAKLASLFRIEGIALNGLVDGTIPVILGKKSVKVSAAKLTAQNKGFVHYRPKTPPPALQGGGEGVSLMLAALNDFRYDSLALALDGEAGGETTVLFHIKGRNPELHDGVPFELNFRLTGPLDRLARSAYSSISLPENIEAALAKKKR